MATIDEILKKYQKALTKKQIEDLIQKSEQYKLLNAGNRANAQTQLAKQYRQTRRGLQNVGLAGREGKLISGREISVKDAYRNAYGTYNAQLQQSENAMIEQAAAKKAAANARARQQQAEQQQKAIEYEQERFNQEQITDPRLDREKPTREDKEYSALVNYNPFNHTADENVNYYLKIAERNGMKGVEANRYAVSMAAEVANRKGAAAETIQPHGLQPNQEQIQKNLPSLRFAQDYGVNLMKLKQEDPAMAQTIEDDVKYWYDFIDERSEFWNNAIRNKTKDYHSAMQMQANAYSALAKLSLAAKAPAEQRQYYLMPDAEFDTAYKAAEQALENAQKYTGGADQRMAGYNAPTTLNNDRDRVRNQMIERAMQTLNMLKQIKKDRASNSTVNLLAYQMQIPESAKTKDKEYDTMTSFVYDNQKEWKAVDWASKSEWNGTNWKNAYDRNWSADDYAKNHDTKGSKYAALINEWSYINGRTALLSSQTFQVAQLAGDIFKDLGARDRTYKWFIDECVMSYRGDYETSGTESQKEQMGAMLTLANLMTDEERARFNALLETMGARAADEYFELLYKTVLPERFTQYVNDEMAFDTRNPIDKVRESVISVPVNLAQGIPGVIHSWKVQQDDPVAARVSATKYNTAQNMRNAVQKDFSKFGQFAYGTGMSMADSATVAMISGGIGEALEGVGVGAKLAGKIGSTIGGSLLGASAYNSTYQEGLERGLTPEKARMTALGAGINEMLFESLSLDMLVWHYQKGGILKVSKKAWVNWIVNTLVQGGVEGSEEVFTDIGNNIWDKMVNGIYSEELTKIREYVKNGDSLDEAKRKVSGEFAAQLGMSFAGGFASGGVMGGGSTFLGMVQNRGNEKVGKGLRQNSRVMNELRNFDFKSEYAQEILQQKNLTNADIADLFNIMQQELLGQYKSDIQKAVADGKITQEQADLLKQYEQNGVQIVHDGEVVANENGITVEQMPTVQDAIASLDNAARIQFLDNEEMRSLVQAVGGETAAVIEQSGTTLREAEKAYQQTVREINNDTTLSPELKQKRLEAAERTRQNARSEASKIADTALTNKKGIGAKLETDGNGTVKVGNGSGKVTYDFSTKDNPGHQTVDSMTATEQSALRLAKIVAASRPDVNVKVEAEFVGEHANENGYYDRSTNTIHINMSGDNSVLWTLSHELTHHLANTDTEAYTALRTAIETALKDSNLKTTELEDRGFEYDLDRVDPYIAREGNLWDALVAFEREEHGYGKDAEEEVVARCCESFLGFDQFVKDFARKQYKSAKAVNKFIAQMNIDMQRVSEEARQSAAQRNIWNDESPENQILRQLTEIDRIANLWRIAVNAEAKKRQAAREETRASTKDSVQMENRINKLREEIASIENDSERLFTNGREFDNARLKKLKNELNALIEQERKASVKTSLSDILANLDLYRRSDLISMAGQLTQAWDDVDEMTTQELRDGIREIIEEREYTPLELQAKSRGLWVRPATIASTKDSVKRFDAEYLDLARRYESGDKSVEAELRKQVDAAAKAAAQKFSIKESDAQYLDLAKKYENAHGYQKYYIEQDIERVLKAVANKNGYTTPMVYHGTPSFGFTVFDTKQEHEWAKKGYIYASTKRNVAANYAGDHHYAAVREIGTKYDGGSSVESIIKDARSIYGAKYRVPTKSDIANRIRDDYKKAKEINDKYDELGSLDAQVPDEVANAISRYQDVIWTVTGNDFAWKAGADGIINASAEDKAGIKEWLDEDFRNLERSREIIRDYFGEHRNELNDHDQKLFRYLMSYEVGDVYIDIKYGLYQVLTPDNLLVSETGNWNDKTELREAMDEAHNIGAYQLYGDLGSKPFIFDADGAQFWALKVPEVSDGYTDTDAVCKWAKENGYTSVVMKNIYDYGEKADNYVFFNSEQVKSADPVTYDNNGNIIPPSERFRTDRTGEDAWKNEDIRYSLKDDVRLSTDRATLAGQMHEGAKGARALRAQAEKYNERIDELNGRIGKLNKRIAELKTQIEDVSLAERMHQGAEDAAALRKVRDEYNERIAQRDLLLEQVRKQRDAAKQHAVEVRKQERAARVRRDIVAVLKRGNDRIVKLLANPTENSHVPVQLAQAVSEYAQRLNELLTTSVPMSGENAGIEKQTKKGALNAQKIIDALNRSYADKETIAALKAEDPSFDPRGLIPVQYDENGHIIKDETLVKMINGMDSIIQGKHLSDLTEDELRFVLNTMRGVIHTVTEANKVTVKGEKRNVSIEARQMANEVNSAAKVFGDKSNKITQFMNRYVIESLGLRRIAKLYSGSNENAVFVKMVDDLNEGALEQERIKQTLRGMFNEVTTKYAKEMDTWYGKNAEWIDTGFGFKITKGMRVSLAMHILNAQNLRNVEKAGLRIPDMNAYRKGNIKEAYKNGKVFRLTKEQAQQIVDNMTEAEKAYFEVAKEFFHKRSGFYINRTSLKLLGYSKAVVDNYFPIQTDDAYRTVKYDDVRQTASVEHPGFLESRNGTANVMYLNDITAVVNRQIDGVAKYAGLAIPMRNWNNIMNAWLFEENEDGEWVRSDDGRAHDVLERRMGYTGKDNAIIDYVDQFITDLTSPGVRDANEKVHAAELAAKLTSNYVKAVLTLNARVALSQLASVPTAAAEIPWKYIVQSFGGNVEGHLNRNASNDLIDQYTPIFAMRRAGTQTEVSEVMKRKGFADKAEQKLPGLLGWITGMDVAATRRLWYACERWVKGETDIPVGSDAFYKEVARRYNRVIQNTQPNFTVLQRSPALRSKNAAARIITMFGTQRMQNAGVFIESLAEVVQTKDKVKRKAAIKKFGRTLSGLITAAIVIGLERALVSALRGRMRPLQDDDKDITVGSVSKYIMGEIGTSLAGSFMYVGEIYDFVHGFVSGITEGDSGYDNSFALPAAEALSTMIKFFKNKDWQYFEYMRGDHTDHEKWLKTISFVNELMTVASYATGLPLANASKTILNGAVPLVQDIVESTKTGELNLYLHQSGKLDNANTAANYKEWTNLGKKGSVYLAWENRFKEDKSESLKHRAELLFTDRGLTADEKAILLRMANTTKDNPLTSKDGVVYKEDGTVAVDFTNPDRYRASTMLSDKQYEGFLNLVDMGVAEDVAATAFIQYNVQKKQGAKANDRFRDWLFKIVKNPEDRAKVDMAVIGNAVRVEGTIGYKENGEVYADYSSKEMFDLYTNGKKQEKSDAIVSTTETPEAKAKAFADTDNNYHAKGGIVYNDKDKVVADFTSDEAYRASQMGESHYEKYNDAVKYGMSKENAILAVEKHKEFTSDDDKDNATQYVTWVFNTYKNAKDRAIAGAIYTTKPVTVRDGRTYDENGYIYRDYTSAAWYKLSNRTLSKDGVNKRYEAAKLLEKDGYTAEKTVAAYVELDKLSKKSEWQAWLKDNGYTNDQINIILWSRGWAKLK